MPPSQLGAFGKSDPSQPTANIEWHVQPLSLDKFGDPLHTFPAITPSVCNLRPCRAGGFASHRPIPRPIPRSSSTISASPSDRRIAVDAMRYTRRIMAARALARFEPEEFRPGAAAQTDDELAEPQANWARRSFIRSARARWGSDEMAVVDDRLRVRGVAGLRVIDASIMPRITSGNTNAPAYMIAEKGAEFILANRKSGV